MNEDKDYIYGEWVPGVRPLGGIIHMDSHGRKTGEEFFPDFEKWCAQIPEKADLDLSCPVVIWGSGATHRFYGVPARAMIFAPDGIDFEVDEEDLPYWFPADKTYITFNHDPEEVEA